MADEAHGNTASRILIAEDHPIVREGLARILEGAGHVVFEAGDGRQAVDAASALQPDLVLMDVLMPGMSGIEATRQITARASAPRVVMLSVDDSPDTARAALQAGAAGYLAKAATSSSLLLDAVHRAAAGETVFIPAGLVDTPAADPGSPPSGGGLLTAREGEIVALAAAGASNSSIAAALALSPRTVENHLSRAYEKLGIAGRAQLARMPASQLAGTQAPADGARGIVLADIAAFSKRSALDQMAVRDALAGVFREALTQSGIAWSDSRVEDRGDGVLAVMPRDVSVAQLIGPFLQAFGDSVERHNGLTAARVNMQLRVAVDAGPVRMDAIGLSGEAVIRSSRLLDSGAFRTEMHARGATFGVIVSEPAWDIAVSQGMHSPAPPAQYVSVRVKEAVIGARMWFTGNAVPPALRPGLRETSSIPAKSPPSAVGRAPETLRYRLLGPLEIWSDGGWMAVSAPKWRSLLGSLLISAGQAISAEELIYDLWEKNPPPTANNLISVYVHRLRNLIGDPEGKLLTHRAGYQLLLPDGSTDAQQFERMVNEARRTLAHSDPRAAAALLDEALRLWRGPLLADVLPSPRINQAAERFAELRLDAVGLKIAADIDSGRHGQAIGELRRHVAEHPLREELWLLLMRALNESGRHAEALDTYNQAKVIISDELGVEPDAALTRMYTEILAEQPGRPNLSRIGSLLTSESMRDWLHYAHRLPKPSTPFPVI